MLAPAIPPELDPARRALLVTAVGAGSLFVCHVNDSLLCGLVLQLPQVAGCFS